MPAEGEPTKNAAHEAAEAALEGLDEILDVLIDIVLPLVLFIAGVFSYSWLGGATSVATLLTSAKVSSEVANHVAPLIPAAVAFGIGGGFWATLGRGKHVISRAIGRLVGAYFLGVGVGYLINAAYGNLKAGALDKVISGAENLISK